MRCLGFPIANDPNYGGIPNYGEEAVVDVSDAAEKSDMRETEKISVLPDHVTTAESSSSDSISLDKPSLATLMANCRFCMKKCDTDKDDHLHYNRIWLHAWKYKMPSSDIIYEAPAPAWSIL